MLSMYIRPLCYSSAGVAVLVASLISALVVPTLPAQAQDMSVPFYHATLDHAGLFVVPGLTAATAAATRPDPGFHATVTGVINATPLYWRPAGATAGSVIVATDSNVVAALNEVTGAAIWSTTLGTPVSRNGQCGNINPVGATGTPVIDTATGTLYVDAIVGNSGAPQNKLFAISLATGAILPNWPVAVGAGVRAAGQSFDETLEEQRGALSLLNGTVYIPFGGYIGDCGAYHGIVAGVATASHSFANAWSTPAEKGGIWAPGGIASDGTSLFVATGNTAGTTTWAGGEAVVRIGSTPHAPFAPADYFTPHNWLMLDDDDYDLGGVSPTIIDLPGATPAHLALALGKDGNAYLLNRAALGGISTALQTVKVADNQMHSATARYTLNGAVMVVLNAHNAGCTGSFTRSGVLALKVATSAGHPGVTSAWCAPLNGRGDPIVTTSDGASDPVVWITGAEGDDELHAYAGDTGQLLYSSAPVSSTIAHFSTLMVANKRIFVTAAGQVLAYDLGGL